VASFKAGIEALAQPEGELSWRIAAIRDWPIDPVESSSSIGALSARVLVGALDDAERFATKKGVAKYGVLSPSIH